MQYPSFTSFKIAIIICIVTIIWIFSWLLMKTFIKNGQKSIPQSNQSIFIRKADVFLFFFRGTTKQLVTFVWQLTRKINKRGRYLKLVTKQAELA